MVAGVQGQTRSGLSGSVVMLASSVLLELRVNLTELESANAVPKLCLITQAGPEYASACRNVASKPLERRSGRRDLFTVSLLARFRGLSTSQPRSTAM